ncbi:CDP-glycerol glycerophosphotransferase family protein [Staphylococcus xylosus]
MEVKVKNNCFIIKAVNHSNIYVYNHHDDTKLFFSKQNGDFLLSIEKLISFFMIPERIFKIYDENNEVINISAQKVKFENKTYLQKKNHTYYIFIDSEDNLSLIYNKKPSLNFLYNKDAIYKGSSVEKGVINLNFEFSVKHFKPTSLRASIIVRNTKKSTSFKINDFSVSDMTLNKYRIFATLKLDVEDIKLILGENTDVSNYDFHVYDVFFHYDINEFPLTNLMPKISFRKDAEYIYNDENWIDYDDENMLLLRSYRTFHGYLSFKLSVLEKDTYQYYKQNILLNYKPIKKNKPTIVCIEYPSSAQDNGLAFFEYLLENYSDKYNVYYVVHKNSPDLENLKKYKNNVVFYKTSENLRILYEADIICHTHTSYYILPFRVNELERELSTKKRVFLQHGIIGVRNLQNMYGRKTNERFTDLFVVSSKREKDIITSNYGFNSNEVILTGLPRFDSLIKEKKNNRLKVKKKKKVLIMPTWRPGLDNLTDEEFKKTEYYKAFYSLINNGFIKNLANYKNIEFNIFMHRNFQKYNHLFNSSFVKTLSDSDHNIKDLLYDSSLLITDYSSVALDFAIMRRKVIYFQPDIIMESNLNASDNIKLPGTIVKNEGMLLEELKSFKFNSNIDLSNIYKFKDKKARKRIFKQMKRQFNI